MTVNTTVNLIPQIKYTCTAVNLDYSKGIKNDLSMFSTKSGALLFDWSYATSMTQRMGFGNAYDFNMFIKDTSAGTLASLKFPVKKNLLQISDVIFSTAPDNSHKTFDKWYKLVSKSWTALAGGVAVPVFIGATYCKDAYYDEVLTAPLAVLSAINTFSFENPNTTNDGFADSFYSYKSKNVVTKTENEYVQSNLVFSAKNVLSINVDRNALPGKWVMAAVPATVPTVANLLAKVPDVVRFFDKDSKSDNSDVKSESGDGSAVQIKTDESSVENISVASTDSKPLTVSLYYYDENTSDKSKSTFKPGVYLNLDATAVDDRATGNKVITGFVMSVSAYVKVKYDDKQYCIGHVKLVSQSVYWNEFDTCGLTNDDFKKVAKKKVDLSDKDKDKLGTYKKAILTNLAKYLENDLIITRPDTSLYNACYCVKKGDIANPTEQKQIDSLALKHAGLEADIASISKENRDYVAANFAFTLCFEVSSDQTSVKVFSYLSGGIKLQKTDLSLNSYTASSTGVDFKSTVYKATFSQKDSDSEAGNTGSGEILNSGGNVFCYYLSSEKSTVKYTYKVNKTGDQYPVMKKDQNNSWILDKVNMDANFVIDPNSDIKSDLIYTDFNGSISGLFSAKSGTLLKDSTGITYSNIIPISIKAFGEEDNYLRYAGAINSNAVSFSLNNKDSIKLSFGLYCCATEKKSFFIVRVSAASGDELKMAGKNIDAVEKNNAVYKAFTSSDFGKTYVLKKASSSDYYLFKISYSEKNGCFMAYISRVFSNSDFVKLDPFGIQDIANIIGVGMFCTAAAASVVPVLGTLSLIHTSLPATEKELRMNILRKNIGIAAESKISVEIGAGNTKMMVMQPSKIALKNNTAINLKAGNSAVNIAQSNIKLKVGTTSVEIKNNCVSIRVGNGILNIKQNEFMYGTTGFKKSGNKIQVVVSGNAKAEYGG